MNKKSQKLRILQKDKIMMTFTTVTYCNTSTSMIIRMLYKHTYKGSSLKEEKQFYCEHQENQSRTNKWYLYERVLKV